MSESPSESDVNLVWALVRRPRKAPSPSCWRLTAKEQRCGTAAGATTTRQTGSCTAGISSTQRQQASPEPGPKPGDPHAAAAVRGRAVRTAACPVWPTKDPEGDSSLRASPPSSGSLRGAAKSLKTQPPSFRGRLSAEPAVRPKMKGPAGKWFLSNGRGEEEEIEEDCAERRRRRRRRLLFISALFDELS